MIIDLTNKSGYISLIKEYRSTNCSQNGDLSCGGCICSSGWYVLFRQKIQVDRRAYAAVMTKYFLTQLIDLPWIHGSSEEKIYASVSVSMKISLILRITNHAHSLFKLIG